MKIIFKLYLLLILIFFISCEENSQLEIIRDSGYSEPAILKRKIINNYITFGLYERYFVFGYNKNKEKFDSIFPAMICHSLNNNEFLSRIDFIFEDYGNYYKYNDGDILSADFTKTIVSVIWDIEKPGILKTKWGKERTQKFIPLKCLFSPEYDKRLQKIE